MAEEDKPKDADRLLDEIGKNTSETLRYSRSRFLATWAATGLLAVLIALALAGIGRNAQTDSDQTEEIAMLASDTADQAAADTNDIVAYMRGEQGIPGVPGTNGEDGSPGLPGEGGTKGQQGPKGDKGDTGTTGTTGPSGPQGLAGLAGPLGPAGGNGPAGQMGTKGEIGIQGTSGADGANGAEGPQGQPGPQGLQGPPGQQGPPGPPFTPRTATSVGTSVRDDSARKTANATCSEGFVSGGGFAIDPSDPGLIVTHSGPVGTNGWAVTVERLSLPAGTQWQILVFAICVT